MNADDNVELSRRERQIMDICLKREPVSARVVWEKIPDQPSYATVRKLMTILVEKGQLKRELEGKKYLYRSARSRKAAAKSAARRLIETFYRGSMGDAVMGLMGSSAANMSLDELERVSQMIETAKKEQKRKS